LLDRDAVTGSRPDRRANPSGLYNDHPKTTSCLRENRAAGAHGMKRLWVMVAAMAMGSALTPARADVVVQIDKSSQRMAVSVDGTMRYSWPVSTGRGGYGTPDGTFHPQSMARHYFSKKYYNAPMPHAIFFYYGFAIHGTNDIAQLGGPASHGCVRLHPANAATLFALVERQGPRNTRIEISN
jgi:lipoprotein-anchoring transpeptidase ErfK/SrfK